MKTVNAVLSVVVAMALVLGIAESFDFHDKDLASEESLWDLYERWRSHLMVSRSLDEKHKRFNVFKQNVKHVLHTNNDNKPYKLMLNKFADMTNHEFRNAYASSKIRYHRMFQGTPRGTRSFMYENVNNVPTSVDWRKRGAVTAVKDQGQCGTPSPCIFLLITVAIHFDCVPCIKHLLQLSELFHAQPVRIMSRYRQPHSYQQRLMVFQLHSMYNTGWEQYVPSEC